MADNEDVLERLYLIRATTRKLARELRNLGVQVARTIEAAESTIDSPGGHTNDQTGEQH